jgi:hypothetical protein
MDWEDTDKNQKTRISDTDMGAFCVLVDGLVENDTDISDAFSKIAEQYPGEDDHRRCAAAGYVFAVIANKVV